MIMEWEAGKLPEGADHWQASLERSARIFRSGIASRARKKTLVG